MRERCAEQRGWSRACHARTGESEEVRPVSLARENCTRRVVSLNGPERVASVTLWKKGLRDWKRVHLDGWGALGARIHSVTHDNLPHK